MKKIWMLVVCCLTGCTILTGVWRGQCGDGFLQKEETCDDGNNISGDGCSNQCELEEPVGLFTSVSDSLEVYVTGTPAQSVVDIAFEPLVGSGVTPSVPAKTFNFCWEELDGSIPIAPLTANLGLKDALGTVVASLTDVDPATGCAEVGLDSPFSLAVNDLAIVFTVFGDVLASDVQQRLVLGVDQIFGDVGEIVGNTPVQTVGRLAYSGFPNCLTGDVVDPTLVNQSGLPAAQAGCEAFGEPVTVDAMQWNMVADGQVGSINGFTVFKDGVGLSGTQVSCSAPAGVNQCLIFAPTADTLTPGTPAVYELRIDVAGSGSGATQTWTLDPEGFAFSVTDGTHDGVGLLTGSATLSN